MKPWMWGAIGVVLVFLAGMATEHRLSTPSVSEKLTAAQPKPGETLPDGGKVAPRAGVTPAKKPVGDVPRGSKVERVSSVTVQPAKADCPPVHVDVTTVAEKDGGKRLVFHANGEILASEDTPTVYISGRKRPWTISLAAVHHDQNTEPGVQVTRDVGPFNVGVLLSEEFQAATFGINF